VRPQKIVTAFCETEERNVGGGDVSERRRKRESV